MSEQELRRIFSQFGTVQTCIVNKEKRHAFVKMITRKDSQAAKDGMERNRTPDSQLRVGHLSFPTPIAVANLPYRQDGVLVSDHAIAVITKLVLASSQLIDSPMQTESGC
jgi:hypothetical protein